MRRRLQISEPNYPKSAVFLLTLLGWHAELEDGSPRGLIPTDLAGVLAQVRKGRFSRCIV